MSTPNPPEGPRAEEPVAPTWPSAPPTSAEEPVAPTWPSAPPTSAEEPETAPETAYADVSEPAPEPAPEPEDETGSATQDAPVLDPEWYADAAAEPAWYAEAPPEPEPVAVDTEPEPERAPEPEPEAVDTEPEPEPLADRPARRSLAPLVVGVLVLLLVAAVAGLALAVRDAEGPSQTEKSRRAALDAARDAARAVFSYDYRHLDKDFAAGKAVTTGKFRSDYESSTSKVVGQVAPRYKAVVVADVSDTAVVTAGENKVVVLVFLDQQSTSTLTAAPKVTQSRLEMTLVRRAGRWLVEDIRAF